MTNAEFRTWLQGFFELSEDGASLAPDQVQMISSHLNLAEAVEKGLDKINEQLRADIDLFRQTGPHSPEEFSAFTADLRERILHA